MGVIGLHYKVLSNIISYYHQNTEGLPITTKYRLMVAITTPITTTIMRFNSGKIL
jgi:hypothetical protein